MMTSWARSWAPSFAIARLIWVFWVATVTVGAALATLAPAYRASRLTVREALAYL
jgi:ABC-type lipoprotein release transport system permease subunit